MTERARGQRARQRTAAIAACIRGLGAWFDHHLYSFVASLGRMFRKPWATLLTVGVMAVALALPLGLWVVLATSSASPATCRQSRADRRVPQAGDRRRSRASALADELRKRARRRRASNCARRSRAWQSCASAAASAKRSTRSPPPASEPAAERCCVVDTARRRPDAGRSRCSQLPEADLVQHDALWRQRLDSWLRFGGRLALVLAALLGLGALLVVGNTVRLDIQSRREEIGVLQLLGATDGFIRRPFLYLGAWYGLAAGALALALLTAAVARAARAAGGTRGQLRQRLRACSGVDPVQAGDRRAGGATRARLARRAARDRPLPAPDPADRT